MGASESKLAFKEDVFRLAREDNLPANDTWWQQFYELPESTDDVFALWSPNDVRNLTLNGADRPPFGTQTAPKKNLETLIYACVARLQALQTKRCFPDPHHPIAHEVLNCMRILTRLLPYIYEAEHLQEWEGRFFWQPRKPTQIWDSRRNRPGEFFDGLNPGKKITPANSDTSDDGEDIGDQEIGPPLGEQLIDLLVRYMFFPAFTLPKRLDAEGLPELKVAHHIWNSGIGCRQSVGMTRENEKNAVEVIRLLLSLCSRQLYIPPMIVADTDCRPLTYMTTKPDRQVALSMLCSLLNTVLKYNPATWRVPVDFSTEGDPKSRLANLSLDLLLVLILYPDPAGEANAYRKAVSRLHRVEDFQFIQQGLMNVLMQPVSGMSSVLGKQVPWAPEMLILFWELLQVNKRFRSFIIETDRAHDFVVLVLYYAMTAKDQPPKQGIVRMCVLILQTMSVEPAFGSRLNKPFVGQESLPGSLRIQNFHGSYADFLVTSIHTLMTTTQGRLESIYPALLAIINNIAPYVRDLQRATSSKLLELFSTMSTPSFLLEKEANHTLLVQLLQAMNAILEHQYSANRRFVEIVVKGRRRFRALRDFTVEGALAELDRQAQERKDRGEGVLTSGNLRSSSELRSPVGLRGSLDGSRTYSSGRASLPSTNTHMNSLDPVSESDAFAIGDDEGDEENPNDAMTSSATFSAPLSASNSVVEEAVPLQSRSMSEKARGKQPVGQGNFSRSTSRNTSTSSLPALITPQTNTYQAPFQQFTPTAQWLETWLPDLQLHTILQIIDNGAQATAQQQVGAATTTTTSTTTASLPAAAAEHPNRQPQEVAAPPPPPKVQAFQWTSPALGWYVSLLWGLVYAADAHQNRGINGIWTGTSIKLFNILSSGSGVSLSSPRGAVDALGDSLARRISSLSFNSSPSIKEV